MQNETVAGLMDVDNLRIIDYKTLCLWNLQNDFSSFSEIAHNSLSFFAGLKEYALAFIYLTILEGRN